MRQPGQALLELAGHRAPVNCMEWSPARRGMLASGADDSLVLVWDLMNQGNAVSVAAPPNAAGSVSGGGVSIGGGAAHAGSGAGVGVNGSGGPAGVAAGAGGEGGGNLRGPIAAWTCDYEVNNVSWAPQSWVTKQSGDWLGVCGGRSVWGLQF